MGIDFSASNPIIKGRRGKKMFGTKVAAMKRIAEETDSKGSASFPTFMLENMRGWQREGLIEIVNHGTAAKITDKGRQLAKKAM